MPVDVLKIDRSFVSNVGTDEQGASIVGAFLELARGLGMTTLAEGIETAEELGFLRERECQLGQGFLFSKPVPPEEIIAYAFGGVPGAAREVAGGAALNRARLGAISAARRGRVASIEPASMPAHARISSGVPEPGMSRTASLITRPVSGPLSASASSTASPRPPSTR